MLHVVVNYSLQDPDERIYIVASYAPYARELLCEVVIIRLNLIYTCSGALNT